MKKGLLGVVADIIKVEKNNETAIETALGGSIQNMLQITNRQQNVSIEFLKKINRSCNISPTDADPFP